MTTAPAEPTDLDAPGPLVSAGRHLIITLLLGLLGLGAGVAYGYSRTDVTTAEARVAVGTNSLTAYQVPGFAQASAQLAANYARYVTKDQFRTALQQVLGGSASQITDVSGSPVPDSNVIRIEVSATDPAAARTAAQTVASTFVARVKQATTGPDPAAALNTYKTLAAQVAQAESDQVQAEQAYQQALDARSRANSPTGGTLLKTDAQLAADVAAANKALTAVKTKIATVQVQRDVAKSTYQELKRSPPSQSGLVPYQPASITGDSQRSATGKYGLVGLVAGLALALVVATLLERRSRRRSVAATRHAEPVDGTDVSGDAGSQRRPASSRGGASPADATGS